MKFTLIKASVISVSLLAAATAMADKCQDVKSCAAENQRVIASADIDGGLVRRDKAVQLNNDDIKIINFILRYESDFSEQTQITALKAKLAYDKNNNIWLRDTLPAVGIVIDIKSAKVAEVQAKVTMRARKDPGFKRIKLINGKFIFTPGSENTPP